VQDTLEADVCAAAIFELTDKRLANSDGDVWEGTCKTLLQEIEDASDERTKKSSTWPKTPRAVSSRLRRLATFMRESGIEITFRPKAGNGQRRLTIRESYNQPPQPPYPSPRTSMIWGRNQMRLGFQRRMST
jgi:hypothetical protein